MRTKVFTNIRLRFVGSVIHYLPKHGLLKKFKIESGLYSIDSNSHDALSGASLTHLSNLGLGSAVRESFLSWDYRLMSGVLSRRNEASGV